MIKKLIALTLLASSSHLMAASMRDAEMAADQGNIKLAMKIWTEFAEQGDLVAQSHLGFFYMNGAKKDVSIDHKKAAYWYDKCVEMDPCKLKLATLLETEKGTKQDVQRALDLYLAVINSSMKWPEGKDDARVKAGLIYLTEKKYKNLDEAEKLLAVAASHGKSEAQYWMGYIMETKQPPQANIVEAHKFYALANSSGKHYDAISALKRLEKKMTRAEIEQAREWANAWTPAE